MTEANVRQFRGSVGAKRRCTLSRCTPGHEWRGRRCVPRHRLRLAATTPNWARPRFIALCEVNSAELPASVTTRPYRLNSGAGSGSGAAKRGRGLVVSKSVELSIWLGIAALALLGAYLLLWRTRRVLSRSRPEPLVVEVRPILLALLAPPSAETESTSSVHAS